MEYQEALDVFVQLLQDRENSRMAARFPNQTPDTFKVNHGRMYDKIVRTNDSRIGGGGTVHCFVKKHVNASKGDEVGDILMSASWSSPAKHTRGSIFDEDPMAAMSDYGAKYLR